MPPKKSGKYTKLTSWSFSVYMNYCNCPYAVCLDKVQRIRMEEAPNPHFLKGNAAHSIAERCAVGTGKMPALKVTLPAITPGGPKIQVDLTSVKSILAGFRKRTDVVVEQEWAFTSNWEPTGWFDKDAWLRMKTDVCGSTVEPPTVDITDWKTGRVHADDHKLQRRIYGLGGLLLVKTGALAGGDHSVKLTAQHVYIETGQTATETFEMKHLSPLKKEWLARIKYMMNDTVYAAKPSSQNCRWCKYSQRTGGPCKEGR